MTRTKATEKSDFWQQLYEQAARYGSPDTLNLIGVRMLVSRLFRTMTIVLNNKMRRNGLNLAAHFID